ncbi:hypothetical protein LROSL1_2333 [Furfurilactobacillus rossiae]|uniref:hypothetical protein n=1 Tax=Furfurilactobacillus rossiae TaxID=231049 RepID=UPI0015BDDEB3|nr:hypothetical protein [Furfurilactobacillus rossiae]MCF6166300.1 hypothetical protein [Furfurilactobacillus rossiae]QLE65134.1 hypothetical protein LROSL1_2333 [Furfurilactobacillus rossiae]
METKDFVLRLLVLFTLVIALFGTFAIGFDNNIVQITYMGLSLEVLGYYTLYKNNHKN